MDFQHCQLLDAVEQVVTKYFSVFFCQTLGCRPIASLDHFQSEMLGSAELVEEVQTGDSKLIKVLQWCKYYSNQVLYKISYINFNCFQHTAIQTFV